MSLPCCDISDDDFVELLRWKDSEDWWGGRDGEDLRKTIKFLLASVKTRLKLENNKKKKNGQLIMHEECSWDEWSDSSETETEPDHLNGGNEHFSFRTIHCWTGAMSQQEFKEKQIKFNFQLWASFTSAQFSNAIITLLRDFWRIKARMFTFHEKDFPFLLLFWINGRTTNEIL